MNSEQGVLGQRKYRGNHDPHLAERLNAEVEEERRREELEERQRIARERAKQKEREAEASPRGTNALYS